MGEWLDVVDQEGRPTGERVERTRAHAEGIRHRTSHVWILRWREGRLQVLLQKRSAGKDSYPGCYDISSAGHIPAGSSFEASAVRELFEELGLGVKEADLQICGQYSHFWEGFFYGKPFLDHEVIRVYRLFLDPPAAAFSLQAEEVEEVRWFDYEALLQILEGDSLPNCIVPEELGMLVKDGESCL